MKLHIETIRSLIREAFDEALDELVSKDMPNGSAWKTKGKGWGAKNAHGVTNYYYGDDENKNKESANKFRSDTKKTKTDALRKEGQLKELSPKTLGSYVKKATTDSNEKSGNMGYYRSDSQKKNGDGGVKADRAAAAANHYEKKANKRKRGVMKATDSLVKKAGDTWKTDSGKQATKNADGSIKYEVIKLSGLEKK